MGWAPGARVVVAFNTIGTNVTENPRFGDQNALLFCCGDNAEAKIAVHSLTADPGFDPQHAGQDFAFQVIRRS